MLRLGDRPHDLAAFVDEERQIHRLYAIDQMTGIGQREQPQIANERGQTVEIGGEIGRHRRVVRGVAAGAHAHVERRAHGRNRRLQLV